MPVPAFVALYDFILAGQQSGCGGYPEESHELRDLGWIGLVWKVDEPIAG